MDVRRLTAAAAATLPLVLLVACGGGASIGTATTAVTKPMNAKNAAPRVSAATSTSTPVVPSRVIDVPFNPVLIGNLSAGRTCSGRDFVAGGTAPNGATGHYLLEVDIVSVASTPCGLEGYPQVVANVPGGTPVIAAHGGGTFTGGAVLPVVVAPGATLAIILGTERDCPARYASPAVYPERASDRVSITMPGGGTVVVPASQDVLCGLSVAPFHQPAPIGPPPAQPPTFALQPLLQAPKSVPAGTTISYTVTLPNDTGGPVSLVPCPSFTETTGPQTASPYLLDCHNLPSLLEPGDILVVYMQVPAPTIPAVLELNWSWGATYLQANHEYSSTLQASEGTTVDIT
jgi:hypothetical protein